MFFSVGGFFWPSCPEAAGCFFFVGQEETAVTSSHALSLSQSLALVWCVRACFALLLTSAAAESDQPASDDTYTHTQSTCTLPTHIIT